METGELTPRRWQRVARPWTYDGSDEEFLYDEEVSGSDVGPEQTASTYRIIRRPNPNFGVPTSIDQGPLRLDSVASALVNTPTVSTTVKISVKLRGFPDWDISPRLPTELFSAAQVESVELARKAEIADRHTAFDAASAELQGSIKGVGGRILSLNSATGWLSAELPADHIAVLAQRDDVVRVHADLYSDADQCDASCSLQQDSDWKLGSGVTGPGGRDEERINAEDFIAAGYDGLTGAANGRFLAAVVETNFLEDEALAFDSWNGGGNRIQGRYECDSTQCTSKVNFNEEGVAAGHGTMVSNVLLGDFEDNQADGQAYGDDCYDGTSHCSDWEKAASGMAPEAALIFYAAGSGSLNKEEAYLHAATEVENVDVLNASHNTASSNCDITSSRAEEDAAEVAFDEGILFVGAAGNNDSGGSTSCDLNAPADTPKVFTVNAFNADNANCASDFQDCDLSTNKHKMGGMDAPLVGGPTASGAITGVDSLAPTHSYYMLDDANPKGIVREHSRNIGTSAAAPHVSGLALLVKDWQKANGNNWIESPGRLHTMMLGMADRANGVQQTLAKGGDVLWGFGRTRLKLAERSAWIMRTTSRSSTGTTTFLVSNDPSPTGTALVKCVLMEDEDMSHKSTVGDVTLKVTLREPVSGSCSQSGTAISSSWDSTFDLKHMVRFQDTFTNLDDVCVDVDVSYHRIAGSSITTHTYCYTSSSYDTAP